MKKIISTILLSIVLFLGITACSLQGEDSDVVIFTQTGCPHCEHAMAYIQTVLPKELPSVTVSEFNIRQSEQNYQLFLKYVDKYLSGTKQLQTPFIVSKGKVFIGWNQETQQTFQSLT